MIANKNKFEIFLKQLARNLQRLLEKEPKSNDSISSKAVRTTFESCMNETAINLLDLGPINSTLKKFSSRRLDRPEMDFDPNLGKFGSDFDARRGLGGSAFRFGQESTLKIIRDE